MQNGSMEGRGYDEPGEKGLVYAEISGTGVEVKLVPLGGTRCAHVTVDISGLSTDEIIKNIRTLPPHPVKDDFERWSLRALGALAGTSFIPRSPILRA